MLLQIKHELENNEFLKADLGPFKEERNEWNAVSLYLTRYKAKITAASTEMSIRSLRHMECRPQLILLDDGDDLESVKTIEGRNKIYEWFVGDVIPAGDRDTRVMVIGSLLHEDCLIKRLQKSIAEGKMDGIYREYPILDDSGNPTWPAKYPNTDAIENERKKGIPESTFQREYMLKIVRSNEQIIRPEWIKDYDVLPSLSGNDYRGTLIAIDPASSELDSADCTAMIAASVFGNGENLQIFIHPNPINKRMAFNETKGLATMLSQSLGGDYPATIVVEDVGIQKWLIQELKRTGLPVEEFKVGGISKEDRLAVAAGPLQAGMVFFSKFGCDDLRRQLINFGMEKHDDLADAFSMLIIRIIEKFRHRSFSFWRPDTEFDSSNLNSPKPSPDRPIDPNNLRIPPMGEIQKTPWKNKDDIRKLEKELDLEIMRRDLGKREGFYW
jgi:phage terminase large subunit-like protein